MIVRCIKSHSVQAQIWERDFPDLYRANFVEEKMIYLVYGILFRKEKFFYEILTTHTFYTTSIPASFFDVIDHRISSLFRIGTMDDGNDHKMFFLSFAEWVGDKDFFGKLVDRDSKTEKIFSHYRDILYLEFRHPEIKESAIILQNGWVQCPFCTEAWELSYPVFEMCRCPECNNVLLNSYISSSQSLS